MGQDMNGDDIHHPNRWVALKNLDIAAMMQEWANIRNKNNAHWKLVDKNCATVVYRVLKEGCRGVGAGVRPAQGGPLRSHHQRSEHLCPAFVRR